MKMVNIKGNFKLGIAVGKYVLSHNTKGQNFPRVLEVKKKIVGIWAVSNKDETGVLTSLLTWSSKTRY